MKRGIVLRNGIIFIISGFVCLIISDGYIPVLILGVVLYSVGAITLNAYNIDKIRYLKTLKLGFQRKGFLLPIKKQKLIAYVVVFFFFISMAFLWGYLVYLDIIKLWFFNLVGLIISGLTLMQLFFALSKPSISDIIEFEDTIDQLLKLKNRNNL